MDSLSHMSQDSPISSTVADRSASIPVGIGFGGTSSALGGERPISHDKGDIGIRTNFSNIRMPNCAQANLATFDKVSHPTDNDIPIPVLTKTPVLSSQPLRPSRNNQAVYGAVGELSPFG